MPPTKVGRKILVISNDVVGKTMAGPGIRCWELAQVLAREFEVTLAHPPASAPLAQPSFRLVPCEQSAAALAPLVEEADVILLDPWSLERLGTVGSDKYVVVDIYDPFLLENLILVRDHPLQDRLMWHANDVRLTELALRRADLMLCASERQADYWLGALTIAGRINPRTYDADASFETMLAVVPFGLPAAAPRSTAPAFRGTVSGIGESDKLIVWGGGLWNWLDPLTIIRAMPQLIAVHPNLRLVFPGSRHPNPVVMDMTMRRAAHQCACELDLLDKHVFFGEWVPYEDRANYLLEADIGISLHFQHVETRMAFRTRLLDYIWIGLPMIVTRGDVMSDWVERWGLGEIVGYEDVDSVVQAVNRLLAIPNLKERYAPAFARVARTLLWEKVAEPLMAFCRNPRRAADLGAMPGSAAVAALPHCEHAEAEIGRLQALVAGYERGRFMRLMKTLHRLRG